MWEQWGLSKMTISNNSRINIAQTSLKQSKNTMPSFKKEISLGKNLMKKSEQKKKNSRTDYSSMILIKLRMLCKKAQSMMSWKEPKSKNQRISIHKLGDIQMKTKKIWRKCKKILKNKLKQSMTRKWISKEKLNDFSKSMMRQWDRSRKKKMKKWRSSKKEFLNQYNEM